MGKDYWENRCERLRGDIAVKYGTRLRAVLRDIGLNLTTDQQIQISNAAFSDSQGTNSRLGTEFEHLVQEWAEGSILPLISGADRVQTQWLPPGADRRRGGINPLDRIIVGANHVIAISPKYSGQAGDAVSIWRGELERVKNTHGGKRCMLLAVKGNDKPFPEALRQGDDPRIIAVNLRNSDSRAHAISQVRLLATIN